MKKYLLLGVIALTMVGCSNVSPKVELTPTEVQQIGDNTNEGAEILIKKAILKDMSQYNYTPTEKKALKEAKENLEIEFYLNRIASQKAKVSDEEIVALYNANKEKLKTMKAEVVLPQIKEQLFLQRVNAEKINYINSLIEKYQLNDKFKTYFPTEEVSVEVGN